VGRNGSEPGHPETVPCPPAPSAIPDRRRTSPSCPFIRPHRPARGPRRVSDVRESIPCWTRAEYRTPDHPAESGTHHRMPVPIDPPDRSPRHPHKGVKMANASPASRLRTALFMGIGLLSACGDGEALTTAEPAAPSASVSENSLTRRTPAADPGAPGDGPAAGGDLGPSVVAVDSPASPLEPLIGPGDLEYLGAFRVPLQNQGTDSFNWGGTALGFNPGRNSILLAGHAHHQKSGEISIPEPVIGQTVSSLPVAGVESRDWPTRREANALASAPMHGSAVISSSMAGSSSLRGSTTMPSVRSRRRISSDRSI